MALPCWAGANLITLDSCMIYALACVRQSNVYTFVAQNVLLLQYGEATWVGPNITLAIDWRMPPPRL